MTAPRFEGWSQVSVIIPAYNAAPYIRETIDSALTQTHAAAEILVVDDGSTDETATRVREYGPPVRLVPFAGGGVSRARNHAASLASAEWLAFLDADDLWLPEKLERQFAAQRSTHDGCSHFVYTDRVNIGVLDGLPRIQSAIQPLVDGDAFEPLLHENVVTTSGVLMKRTLFAECGGFDERLQAGEDWDLWLRCAQRTLFVAVRESLIQYRLHPAGASRNSGRMNRARTTIIERALATRRGIELPRRTQQKVRAALWRTNGWDAARDGHIGAAARAYVRSLRYDPLQTRSIIELVKLSFGR